MVCDTQVAGVELWPHQVRAVEAVHEAVREGRTSGLIVLPTGAGKSIMFAWLARQLGLPTLILAHRDELLLQAARTVQRVWPDAKVGLIQAERDQWRDGEQVVVASVQSLHARRLERMPRDRFGLVVVDETHHVAADSYGRILEHFSGRRFLLGVTATPQRADGVGLHRWYGERPLFVYKIRQAVEDGVLARPVQFQVETGLVLDGVGHRAGDFVENELARVVNTPERNRAVVEAFVGHARRRKAIAFCVDVRHAKDLAAAFERAGVRAEAITGEAGLHERRVLLERFSRGEFRVATSCQVLTEGFDDPAVDAVIMARPTASHGLYLQCVGRGLRRHPGKTDCLILDVVGNPRKHKLWTAADLMDAIRPHEERGDRRGAAQQDGGKAKEHGGPVVWRSHEVSPWPRVPDLTDYRPSEFWHRHRATDAQLRCLRGFGLDVTRELTKGEAHYLIDQATKLDAAHPAPATEKQKWLLRRERRWRPGMSKREATRIIAAIKGGAVASA